MKIVRTQLNSAPLEKNELFFPTYSVQGGTAIYEKEVNAFGEMLYREYYARIHHYFNFRIFDKEEAEDLAQTVFLKIFRSLKSGVWEGAGGICYIFTVARNTLIDYFRLKRHTSIVSDELVQLCGDVSMPEHTSGVFEYKEVIDNAMNDLREEEREAVTLRYFSDMEYSAIALVMKKKECTVRQLVHRGLKSLRGNSQLQML